MSTKTKGRTFTLLKHHFDYLDQRCKDGYSRSRWLREAIDARMAVEMAEAKRIVQRAIIAKKRGDSAALAAKFGALDRSQAQAIGEFRTSIHQELTKLLLDPDGQVQVPEDGKSEVRGNLRSDEGSESE